MNPSVLEYLQSQQDQMMPNQMPELMPEQMTNLGQELPMQMSQIQQAPMPAPQMQQAPQEQAQYNPFDSGIQKAISSARESLGMTEAQKDRALRSSILAFGDSIGTQNKQKGFRNNLVMAGQALSPAISEYDKAEDAAITQNNNIANQILNRQAAEQQRQSQLEDKNWRRGFEEEQFATKKQQAADQLEEQKRYHDLMKPKGVKNEKNSVNEQGFDPKTLEHIRKQNVNNMEEMYKKNKASEVTTKAFSDIKDILVKEQKEGGWQQGSSFSAQISRFTAAAVGKDESAQMILLKRMPLYSSLKDMFGSRITNLDLELFIKSLPGLDQPPEVAIKALDDLINNEKSNYKKNKQRQEIVEEWKYSVPMYSPQVDREIERRLAFEEQPISKSQEQAKPKTGITLYDPDIGKTYYNVTPEHAEHYLSQNPRLEQI